MEKMNCDIIRDLIPSYVDAICSEATKNCVESHIESCCECREMVELCRNHVLTDDKAEKIALNGLKKIKKRMNIQFIINIVLIVVVCFCIQRFHHFSRNLATSLAVLLTICMCINLLFNISGQLQKPAIIPDYIIGFLSLLINISTVSILYYAMQNAVIDDRQPVIFGLLPSECGPFFSLLFTAAFFLQLTFFVYCLIGIHKLHKNLVPLSCLAVTEVFLTSAYLALFHTLDTPESFRAISFRLNIISIVIAVLGTLTSMLLMKNVRNHSKLY